MSPFAVEISDHAAKRLKERRISRTQVRACLVKGRLEGVDVSGRRVKRLKINGKVLETVYLESAGGYLVVTAYWRDIWP